MDEIRIRITYRWDRDGDGATLTAIGIDPRDGRTARVSVHVDTRTAVAFTSGPGSLLGVDLPEELRAALDGHVEAQLRDQSSKVGLPDDAEPPG